MAKHKPKSAAKKPSGSRAPEPWDNIARGKDCWVMPDLYTHPERPWKGYFNEQAGRRAGDTNDQFAETQYLKCYENEFMGLYLYLFQDMATRRNYPNRCRRGP